MLDRMLGGTPIDAALTNWGRANRYAGSGDRAAIRDLVFDAWRCKQSYSAFGGGETGRGLMLGRMRALGEDVGRVFTGIGHAPSVLSDADAQQTASDLEALDCPEWLAPRLRNSLGDRFDAVMKALQHRAPVFLRVNLAKSSLQDVVSLLAADGIDAVPHPMAAASLEVRTSSRKLLTILPYMDGLFELQDVASQAIVDDIPAVSGQKILD